MRRAGGALMVAGALLAWAATGVMPARAQDRVVRSFEAGSAAASVGVGASDAGEDKEEDGPQALATSETGKLFLLDQVNGRILKFDPAKPQAEPQAFILPKNVQPTDLVVKGDDIYVWDGRIHALQALGADDAPTRGLTETRSAEPVDETTETAFAQMGSVPPLDDQPGTSTRGVAAAAAPTLARQAIDTRGRGPVVATVTLAGDGAGAAIALKTKAGAPIASTLTLRVRDRLGLVAFLDIDRSGRLFVLAENIPHTIATSAGAFVLRFSPSGAVDGVYELPLEGTTAVSRRFVTVSPDGDVYFLKTRKDGVDVLGLGFRSTPKAKVVDVGRPQPQFAAEVRRAGANVNIAAGPLTRQKVVDMAYAFEAYRWTVEPTNYGSEEDAVCSGFNGRIRRPMYLIDKKGQLVHSVPYCWGCQGSLAQFSSKVERGELAGNVCTRDGPRPDVIGVDCSSFVCATWGLSTHFSTAAIPEITVPVENPWRMLPGDAFDKPGSHVVLFLNYTGDREVEVMEASPGACGGKVCRSIYPMSSLLERGYVPVRYRGLIDAMN